MEEVNEDEELDSENEEENEDRESNDNKNNKNEIVNIITERLKSILNIDNEFIDKAKQLNIVKYIKGLK